MHHQTGKELENNFNLLNKVKLIKLVYLIFQIQISVKTHYYQFCYTLKFSNSITTANSSKKNLDIMY